MPTPDGPSAAICLHAWRYESGDQTYADATTETPDGWTVYTRLAGEPVGEIDLSDEVDFETEAEAIAEAERRVCDTGFPLFSY